MFLYINKRTLPNLINTRQNSHKKREAKEGLQKIQKINPINTLKIPNREKRRERELG